MKRTSIAIAVLAVFVAGPVSFFTGCDARDIVPVPTPAVVQNTFGIAPSMSYREAEQNREVVNATVAVALDQWGENINSRSRWVAAIASLQTAGIEFINNPTSLAASGGLTGIAAAFLAGWLGIRRPGDVTPDAAREREHKARDEAEAKAKA